MLLTRLTETVPVTPDQLYARWIDINTHPQWTTDLEWVDMPTPLQVGSKGQVMGRDAKRPSRLRITRMERRADGSATFCDSTPLTLAHLDFEREARPVPGGSEVTITCRTGGLLASFWARLLGGQVEASGLRRDLDNLVRLIQQSEGTAGTPAPGA